MCQNLRGLMWSTLGLCLSYQIVSSAWGHDGPRLQGTTQVPALSPISQPFSQVQLGGTCDKSCQKIASSTESAVFQKSQENTFQESQMLSWPPVVLLVNPSPVTTQHSSDSAAHQCQQESSEEFIFQGSLRTTRRDKSSTDRPRLLPLRRLRFRFRATL